ncbi:MAG: hypothetical protein IPJ65_19925 [Archangiaceae bacterium]|nr:hypothetical protein [Archangiaceae bacterium]
MTPTLVVIAALLATSPDAPTPEAEDVAAHPSFAGYTARRHLELTMGFLGGVRDETRNGYAFGSGTSEARALTGPFALAPYARTIVYGLGWETRYVTQHVRFTVGLQKPFASFRMMDAIFPADVGGTTREVGTRSLELWDVRFGLGGEYAFKYVTPFVDVIGDVQSVKAALTVDQATAEYKAWAFGLVVRAGLRVQLGDSVFVAPMGEVGIGGPVLWGAGLQAGWVLPMPG